MRTAIKIISVFLIIFLIWNIYVCIVGKDATSLAVHGTASDYVSTKGHLIKYETVVQSPYDGILQPYVSDCEMVAKGVAVAAVLNGETDESTRAEITELKSRIEELERIMASNDGFGNDILGVDAEITEKLSKISGNAARGKLSEISKYKNEIIMLSDKRSVIINNNGSEILGVLKSHREEIESKLGSVVNELYSPASGVFTVGTDGLEGVLTPDRIDEITIDEIENIKNTASAAELNVSQNQDAFKIINNFEWYMAVIINEEDLQGIEEGNYLKISFRDANSKTAPALVRRISQPEDGKVLVVFKLNRDLDGILRMRHVTVDIIKSYYEGLKIPSKAICVSDGKTGVYVKNSSEKEFREIEILYRNDDFAIVREDNTKEGGILLYDNVVTSGDN